MFKKILLLIYLIAGITLAINNTNNKINASTNHLKLNSGEILTSFQQLPNITPDVKINFELQKSNDKYIISFNIPGLDANTLIVTELPHVNIKDFKRKDSDIRKMQYWTNEDNERILFYEFNDVNSENISDKEFNGFRPFVHYNIDTREVNGTDSLLLFGNTIQQGQAFYTDVLFPFELDDLLEISIRYDYRSRYGALGIGMWWGAWNTYTVTRFKGQVESKLKWWEKLLNATIDPSNITSMDGWIQLGKGDAGKAKHFENINHLATTSYKTDYVKKINEELSTLGESKVTTSIFGNNNSLYRVYVDSNYRFGETKYQVNNLSVISVKYIFQGEYYAVYEDDITSIITKLNGKSSLDNILDRLDVLIDWFKNNTSGIIIVVIAFVALMLLGPVITVFKLVIDLIKMVVNLIASITKFIFSLPGKLIQILKFLFVPKKKKPERKYKK